MAIKIICQMTDLSQFKAWKEEDTQWRTLCSLHWLHEERGQQAQTRFHYHTELYPTTSTYYMTVCLDNGLGKQPQGEFLG